MNDRTYPEAMIETQYLNGGKGPSRRMFLISEDALAALLPEWAESVGALATGCTDTPSVADSAYDFIHDRCEDFDVSAGDDNPPVKWSPE